MLSITTLWSTVIKYDLNGKQFLDKLSTLKTLALPS